jgi:hypothetical protein
MLAGMRILVLIVMVAVVAAPALAQEMYRWVDEHGTVHYSDTPRDGAERVQLRPLPTYDGRAGEPRVEPAPDAAADDPALGYTAIRIVAPEDDAAIWATGGGMTVQVETVPALQAGHGIVLWLNGDALPGMPVSSTTTSISGLNRGTHTLYAAVVDADGYQQIESPAITFHVLQASIHQPQRR